MITTRYNIMCRVSGGVTGTREALLKSGGVLVYFNTKAEAQAEATRLMVKRSNDPYCTADFRYWPVEAGSEWL